MSDIIDCQHIYLHMDDFRKISKSSEEVIRKSATII